MSSKKLCQKCQNNPVVTRRTKNSMLLCKKCFIEELENDIFQFIKDKDFFQKGERIVIACSGGKDSTVLLHILYNYNIKFQMELDLQLLSIDEGISGYRDDSLKTVLYNSELYHLPLTILSYQQLFGWTMDNIVKKKSTSNCCTHCGVLRRQALDRGCYLLKASKITTGHCLDDMSETILLNFLRGDSTRLSRCGRIDNISSLSSIMKIKPLAYTYEKEIVLYAYYQQLQYFSTECKYSPYAYRGYVREFIKELEIYNPLTVLNIMKSAEDYGNFHNNSSQKSIQSSLSCQKCNCLTNHPICQACTLIQSLNEINK